VKSAVNGNRGKFCGVIEMNKKNIDCMESTKALFWEAKDNRVIQCLLCPHNCIIDKGEAGRCGVRSNINGTLYADSYGKVSSIALDPIEKKPLKMYQSGKKILSIGSFGCNLNCPFCQNYGISLDYRDRIENGRKMTPVELVTLVKEIGMKEDVHNVHSENIGVAYTYNEPLVGFEFVLECAKQIYTKGMKNVLITNGFINSEPLKMLLPYIDAMNIDLKSFSEEFYRSIGGDLGAVKKTIELAANKAHVEITTLIIPNENDSENEINELAAWIASLNPDIPLHLSRFFPTYEYHDRIATPIDTVYRLGEVAKQHLNHVFLGNL